MTRRWALVIALNRYLDESINLSGPEQDGAAFHNHLVSALGFGFDQVEVLFSEDATLANVLTRIEAAVHAGILWNEIVIYFAGHASELASAKFWRPQPRERAERAIRGSAEPKASRGLSGDETRRSSGR